MEMKGKITVIFRHHKIYNIPKSRGSKYFCGLFSNRPVRYI